MSVVCISLPQHLRIISPLKSLNMVKYPLYRYKRLLTTQRDRFFFSTVAENYPRSENTYAG